MLLRKRFKFDSLENVDSHTIYFLPIEAKTHKWTKQLIFLNQSISNILIVRANDFH